MQFGFAILNENNRIKERKCECGFVYLFIYLAYCILLCQFLAWSLLLFLSGALFGTTESDSLVVYFVKIHLGVLYVILYAFYLLLSSHGSLPSFMESEHENCLCS